MTHDDDIRWLSTGRRLVHSPDDDAIRYQSRYGDNDWHTQAVLGYKEAQAISEFLAELSEDPNIRRWLEDVDDSVTHEYSCGFSYTGLGTGGLIPTTCPECGADWIGAWVGDERPAYFEDDHE